MSARIIILLIIFFLAGLLIQRLRRSPAVTSNRQRQQILYAVLVCSLLLLAISGHLNWLFALLASLLPLAKRLLPYLRHIPLLRSLISQLKPGPQTQNKQTGANDNTNRPLRADYRMSVNEAREILNLPADANDEEIISAHRRLIQKFHPDRGGSAHLASKINQARSILLEARKQRS